MCLLSLVGAAIRISFAETKDASLLHTHIVVLNRQPLLSRSIGGDPILLRDIVIRPVPGDHEIGADHPAFDLVAKPDERQRLELQLDPIGRAGVETGMIPTGKRVSMETWCQRPSTRK